jgi:sugar transferase (PEP-CTERM/EpsH1 system associated)
MRILFLTQRLPYAPNRGDRVRAYHELRLLAAHGHEVHLVSLVHDDDEASHERDLDGIVASVHLVRVPRLRNLVRGAATLVTSRPLTHALLDGPAAHSILARVLHDHRPELVFAYCSSMVRFALEVPLAGLPFVMDMVDVDSGKWAALADTTPLPKRWIFAREARHLAAFESLATRRAQVTWVVNAREATLLRRLTGPDARIDAIENGVDVTYWRRQATEAPSHDVVFCGVMDYAPNEEAGLWIAREVWPRVAPRVPDARLCLVGANPTRRLQDLSGGSPSVVVTGTVPDVRPYLWRAAVAAAPLHVARGVQNKVLEAVAAGLPAVITPAVAGGLPPEILPACTIADSAEAFGDALCRLLSADDERGRLVRSARLDALDWHTRLAPMARAIDEWSRASGRHAAGRS